MAKIDTSAIEGYADMTAEQKLAALEGFEIPESNNDEVTRLKTSLSKSNSECADWKKKFRDTQSEAERAAAEREEENRKRDEELKGYKDRERIFRYSQSLMASGYDSDTASAMAKELPDGMPDSFFTQQKTFIENKRKAFEAEAINKQPDLSRGSAPQNADTDKMSDSEYYDFVRRSR